MYVMDGWDDCIIGVAEIDGVTRVVYSRDKMIEKQMEEGSTYEDADEHISVNVEGSFINIDPHPVLVRSVEGREEIDLIAEEQDDD